MVGERAFLRLGRLQHRDGFVIPAALAQVSDRDFRIEHFVRLGISLGSFDTGCHRTFHDERVRPLLGERPAQIHIQRVQVFPHRGLGQ